ncbi:structural maintenance of chromosomes protein 5-like [Corticium candelabrum]|uniref:structural maintenance of chromosomes protein 5-like n=1 Tax=Corticium candelabrum TaxID=121492 RepID=UPI002E25F66A|nr:structural maintenance of chromosomes protein 5-like [Corticium candelabrum]
MQLFPFSTRKRKYESGGMISNTQRHYETSTGTTWGNDKILARILSDLTGFVITGETFSSNQEHICYEQSGNATIKRLINREGNTSRWQVNGRDVSQKQVMETVKRLNIQVGNRCQFLPQDMVVEFAKMSPSELLLATEKALDCDDLTEKHKQLVEIQKNEQGLIAQLESEEQLVERLNHQQELDKPEVDRYWLRKQHDDKLRLLEQKRPWVEYENSRKQYKKCMEEKNEMKKVLDKLKEENEPMDCKVQEAIKAAKKVENEAKDIVQKTNKNMAEARKLQDKMTTLEADLEDPKKDYETKVAIETKRMRKSWVVHSWFHVIKLLKPYVPKWKILSY